MRFKFPVLWEVEDHEGYFWDVREARATKHGFDLYFGCPATRGGTSKLIVTQALWDFWDVNCVRSGGFLFDLPAGRTTLKRARKRLGFNFDNDWQAFWEDRLDDLANLPPREFAAKHRVRVDNVVDRRARMIGRRARPSGWWRAPEVLDVLMSNFVLREVGELLGISISQAFRLREQAKLIRGVLDSTHRDDSSSNGEWEYPRAA